MMDASRPTAFVPQDGLPRAQRNLALLTIALAVAMSVLDSAVTNIALPAIGRDLQVSPGASVWVVNSYQIAVMITLLPFSSLGDIFGYRRVYTFGLVVFTIASLFCAMAHSLPMIVAARVVQGFGGAGIMSVNTALIRYAFPRSQLGRGLGFNSLVVASSSAAGPTIAAIILSVANWPWLFLVNLPIGVLALSLISNLPHTVRSGHRFDFLSAVLNALMLGLLVGLLDGFGHGQNQGQMIAEGLGCLAAGVVFVRRMLRHPAPMLPVDLFRRPIFALSVATSVASFIAQTGAYVAIPFLLESVGGLSDTKTGLLMTPWPVTVALIAPLAGRLSDRYSAGALGSIGLSVMTAGLLSIGFMPAHAAWWDIAWRMALSGAGFALFQSPNNRLVLGSVPRERSGAGSGMISTARLTGQSLGAALVASCFHMTEAGGVEQGAMVAVFAGAGFAGVAAVLSALRLSRRAPAG